MSLFEARRKKKEEERNWIKQVTDTTSYSYDNLKKVLIVSDIHGHRETLDEIIKLETPDLILSAGDNLLSPEYLMTLPILFVKGNNDWFGPEKLIITINDIRIGMIHGHKQFSMFHWDRKLANAFENEHVDLIIYGHSHKNTFNQLEKPWILNPGSISYPRNKEYAKTYAILEFARNNKISIIFKTIN